MDTALMTPQPASAVDSEPAHRVPIYDTHGTLVGFDTGPQDAATREWA
jgi:hypothetical protein